MRSPSHPRVLPSHQHEPRVRQGPPFATAFRSSSVSTIIVPNKYTGPPREQREKSRTACFPRSKNDRSSVCCSEDTCSTRMCTSAKIFPTEAGQSQEEEEENAENFLGHGKMKNAAKRERENVCIILARTQFIVQQQLPP